MKWISRAFVFGVSANQYVVAQNWLHFLSQPASTVLGTCKLPISHHHQQFVYETGLSIRQCRATPFIAKNLGVALLECYAFRTPDAFCEGFLLFTICCCKFNNEATSYESSIYETVYEYTAVASVRVTTTCDYETSVFYMDDVLRYCVSWLCMYKESDQ